MNVLYSYIDFLVRSFDAESKTSRRCYWAVFGINAALSILLTSIGVMLPHGQPLEIYIGVSSVIATPLFIPFFTVIARRLNDADIRRRWMLLLLIPGLGLIPLLFFCTFPSKYGTQEDYTSYRNGTFFAAIKKYASNAMAIVRFDTASFCASFAISIRCPLCFII